jgi:hypothetical protein
MAIELSHGMDENGHNWWGYPGDQGYDATCRFQRVPSTCVSRSMRVPDQRWSTTMNCRRVKDTTAGNATLAGTWPSWPFRPNQRALDPNGCESVFSRNWQRCPCSTASHRPHSKTLALPARTVLMGGWGLSAGLNSEWPMGDCDGREIDATTDRNVS